MLVSGLRDNSLLRMASGRDVALSSVHKSLCECAREMLGKYRRQLERPWGIGKTEKLGIKARATKILLTELCRVPGDSAETRETIAHALKRHAEALQNHEHLLSMNGNTYQLMEQTRWLRAHDATASLLRYHDLKNKFLASDTPLLQEQRSFLSAMDGNKSLTMRMLECLDEELFFHRYTVSKEFRELRAGAIKIAGSSSSEAEKTESLYELLATEMADDIKDFSQAMENDDKAAITKFIEKTEALINALPGLKDAQKAELVHRLLVSKGADDIPGFYITLLNDDSDAVFCFIHKVTEVVTRLLPPEKQVELVYELLATAMAGAIKYFSQALKSGDIVTMTRFIKKTEMVIKGLPRLEDAQKAELVHRLLACKGDDGIPGFHMTLRNGYTDAVFCFIYRVTEVIVRLMLFPPEKQFELVYEELLACKNVHGTPGFFATLQEGHSHAARAFIQAINAATPFINMSPMVRMKFMYDLLVSKAADGTPGFFMTMQNGNPELIKTFIEECAVVVAESPFHWLEKSVLLYQLFDVKRADGAQGFAVALQQGHSKAISAFIQAIAAAMFKLTGSNIESNVFLYEFLDRLVNHDKPNFLAAMKRGGPEVCKAFIEGIDRLPLSGKQKEILKHQIPCPVLGGGRGEGEDEDIAVSMGLLRTEEI